MAKRKKKASPWVLLHEIFMPMNRVRSQRGRRDIVTLAKLNQSGKVMQAKKIPQGMIRFFEHDGERNIQIDSEFTSEFESIVTVRHFVLLDVSVSHEHEHSVVA